MCAVSQKEKACDVCDGRPNLWRDLKIQDTGSPGGSYAILRGPGDVEEASRGLGGRLILPMVDP